MSISALRLAVTTAGGSPTQRTHVGLLRELITSWGGVPTQWTINGLLKEAIVNRGGVPTQNRQNDLLRQLITQLGGTPSSYYEAWGLWDQLASLSTIGPPTLFVLGLTNNTISEDAAAGTVVGNVSNNKALSTLSLSDDAGGRFALVDLGGGTWRVVRGATALDYETAQTHNITIVETLAGATGNPKSTTLPIGVTNVLETALAALGGAFSLAENAAAGTTAGALTGKSTGSTLSLLDDAGGRVALSGSNIVRGATALDYEANTSHSFTVRETHADGTNSPRDTVLSLTVTNAAEAPTAFTFSDVSPASTGSTWTSNVITVAGLAAGDSAPYSFTGDASRVLKKNGVTVANNGTAVNGDQFTATLTASASNGVTVNAVLTIGTTTDTFSVVTPAIGGGDFSSTTPAIVKNSAAGASPFDFYIDEADLSLLAAGDYLEIDVGTDITSPAVDANGYFVDQAYTPVLYLLTESDITALSEDGTLDIDLTAAGFTTISGTMAVHMRYARGVGSSTPVYSLWSNQLYDTISAATTQWAGTVGTDKHANINVSGTPRLTVAAINNGSYQYVRSTQQAGPNEAVWEYTITTVGGRLGMDERVQDFSSYTGFPGGFTGDGFYLVLSTVSSEIWANAGGLNTALTNGALLAGDVITFVLNKTTGLLKLFRTRSGTTVALGAAGGYTLTNLTAYWIYFGDSGSGAGVLNTGQSAFARALSGSEAPFG